MSNLILQPSNQRIRKQKRPYGHWKQPRHPRLVAKGVGKTKKEESTKVEKCLFAFSTSSFSEYRPLFQTSISPRFLTQSG